MPLSRCFLRKLAALIEILDQARKTLGPKRDCRAGRADFNALDQKLDDPSLLRRKEF